jgi:hypothetical protein
MLVTFKTKAHASITMFGDVALTLIKLMGHSGTIPSAILAEDVPAALEHLRRAVSAHPEATLDPKPSGGPKDQGDDIHVSLAHRALPLIELLEAAAAAGENVMWEGT